jgi:tRNA (guanine37-N1)-methyltransferase
MASWRELVKNVLTPAQQAMMRASYDTVGDIAIVEIAKGLVKKEKKLAALLLKSQPSIKVVAKRVGGRRGTFRSQVLKVIAGERRLTTTHIESGCRMMLDVRTCYFSPRMGTERLRIAFLVKPRERILVLFSGIAPFPLVMAKQAASAKPPIPMHVDAVELNRAAHDYAVKNIAINKLGHYITPVHADAKKFLAAAANAKLTYDRILLAWPGHAEPYIAPALKILKQSGTLHFYDFQYEQALDLSAAKVRAACKKARRVCVIKNIVVCGQKAPHVVRVCVDAVMR